MRTTIRRPIATSLLLVGAMLLLTGCGDAGSHLPAGMTGSGSAHLTPAGGDVLGSDPGPLAAGVASGVEDPVLAGYDGLEEIDSLASDDPFSRASQDWSETEGSLSTMGSAALDDLGLDEGPMPVGHGGYDDGWGSGGLGGYGSVGLSSAGYGGGWGGNAALVDGGMVGAGMDDLSGLDTGLEDPGFVDGAFDAGFVDAGMDVGFVDAGFDGGIDPGFVDAGAADFGVDPGFVDTGFADVGAVDVGGFDAGLAVY